MQKCKQWLHIPYKIKREISNFSTVSNVLMFLLSIMRQDDGEIINNESLDFTLRMGYIFFEELF